MIKILIFYLVLLSFLEHDDKHNEDRLLTVIIPCFKCRIDWLEECLESFYMQTVKVDIVLVLDGPHPKEQMIMQFKHRNVKIIKHLRNRGLAAARNTGARHAQTRFLFGCRRQVAL